MFGRIPDLIAEALGDSKALMEQELAKVITPYFERQKDLAKVLHPDGNTERFEGSIKSLAPADLIKVFLPQSVIGPCRSESDRVSRAFEAVRKCARKMP